MALKENIEALKQELSAQEQLLENIIISERFFKKHKRAILSTAVVLLLLLVGYVGMKAVRANNLQASNEAYKTLLSNPADEEALSVLKGKNKPLYRAFVFKEALKNNDDEALRALTKEEKKDIISELAAYQLQENIQGSNILENLIVLEEGYKLLKEGKSDEASIKFMTIPSDSS
ncbi:MAG: hypothetical protein LBS73_04505, partial [Campylobacteraceae bacterium]|nr:hypothetical protein [Campylobacteraceae bacterium]